MAKSAAARPAMQPCPTALAICHGFPVTSPHAKTPGTEVLHPASTLMESSISGITSMSMARSAADLAPSSMNTPSVGMTVPSSSSRDSTLPSPRMALGLDPYTLTPAASALAARDGEARSSQRTQEVSDA